MQCQRIAVVIGLCICLSGCHLASDITHNLYFETCLFTNDVKAKVYYPCLAVSAWHAYRAHCPEYAESSDFGCGFKAGYADYLEYGGDAHSPRLPPLRYWKVRRETPAGRQATKLWLAGFRAGADAAHRSGYRQLIVVPVDDAVSQPPFAAPPLTNPPPTPPSETPPIHDELPDPRTLPPSVPPEQGGPLSKAPSPPDRTPIRRPLQTTQPPAPDIKPRVNPQGSSEEQQTRPLSSVDGGPSLVPFPSQPKVEPTLRIPPLSSSRVAKLPEPRPPSAMPAKEKEPLEKSAEQAELPRIVTGESGDQSGLPRIISGRAIQLPEPPRILTERSIEQPDLPPSATGHGKSEAAMPVDWTRVPRNAEMLSRIGRMTLEGASPEVGVKWLHAALQVDPHHAPTHKALMEYYERKGDFFRAAEHRAQAEAP